MEDRMIFIISLLLGIIFHEFGHLIIAKLFKCKVEVFSIGFGKELFSFNYKGTKYRLALFLLGGYNKLDRELDYCKNKYVLPNLPYHKKLLIILAGCFINIIIGGVSCLIGKHYLNYNLFYFGWINLALGVTNLIPFPALDGSYPLLFLIEKIIPKKYALQLIRFLVHWGFLILMIVNIACIPWLIELIIKGKL
jgi:membrane-associated protease RseP (regulator of RpoE activity)